MTMKSPGWAGMVVLDARLTGKRCGRAALRPDPQVSLRAETQLESSHEEWPSSRRSVSRSVRFAVARFAVALLTFLPVALFAVVFLPVVRFAGTLYLPSDVVPSCP